MGKKVRIQLAPGDQDRLEALIANGNTPQKHVRRARIVRLAGDGVGTDEIQRRLGVSKPTIRRWRTRYVEAGVDGLCRDKTRPPGKAPLAADVVVRVIEKTKTETPPDATHWSLRTMAKAVGIAPSSVQAIWKAHELKPHLVATFKLSNDPRFAEKVEDVVGLYVNPPEHAIVLSVDEKSQIQALDRTQPGLPMKKGRAGTMTHDYKRHDTTTLFAALDVLDGTVIGQCMQKHRHQEFIRFLNKINRATLSTAAGICTGAAAQKCTTGSVVACPRSPWEGPARGATRPPRGWRRPARGRGLWAHAGKRGVIRTVAGVVTGSA